MSDALLAKLGRASNCLLAASAGGGGRWLTPIRDGGVPRRFTKHPNRNWTVFQTALNGIGLDDFELILDIYPDQFGNGWMFICSTMNTGSVGVLSTELESIL